MKKNETIPEFLDRISPDIPLERFNIHTFIDDILEISNYEYFKTWNGYDIRLAKVLKYRLTMNDNGRISNYILLNNK